MKYTHKSGDWVEIEGISEWSMRDLEVLSKGNTVEQMGEALKPVIKAWHFVVKGVEVPVGDVMGLPLKKWLWLLKRINDSLLDETLDPEA